MTDMKTHNRSETHGGTKHSFHVNEQVSLRTDMRFHATMKDVDWQRNHGQQNRQPLGKVIAGWWSFVLSKNLEMFIFLFSVVQCYVLRVNCIYNFFLLFYIIIIPY